MAGSSSKKKSSKSQTSTPRPTPRPAVRRSSRNATPQPSTPSSGTRGKKRKAETEPEDESLSEGSSESDSELDDLAPASKKQMTPAQAARLAREKEEEHNLIVRAKTRALREAEAPEEPDQLDQPGDDAEDDVSVPTPSFDAVTLGIRPAAPSQAPVAARGQSPSGRSDKSAARSASSNRPTPPAATSKKSAAASKKSARASYSDGNEPDEEEEMSEGRKMTFEVVDVQQPPTPVKKTKKKRLTKKKSATPPPSSSDVEEDDSEASSRSKRRRRRSKRRKTDEDGSAKFTRDDFSPEVYRTLQTLKKVVRRYFLMKNLFVYTDGDKTDVYASIWKSWARSDEAPADAFALFSEVANDRELMEKCCIYINYTRPYFCLIILHICRTYLSWLGIPGTKSPEEIEDLVKWLLDEKLKVPLLHGGLDVEACTFDKRQPYRASWLIPAIHDFVWNKRGALDKWASREVLQQQAITAPTFVLFTTCMCHALHEYSSGKRPHFLPFDAASNAYRYFIQLTRINRLCRRVSRYFKPLTTETFDKCMALSNKGALMSAPKDSEGEDTDDFDFAMLNEAADAIYGKEDDEEAMA